MISASWNLPWILTSTSASDGGLSMWDDPAFRAHWLSTCTDLELAQAYSDWIKGEWSDDLITTLDLVTEAFSRNLTLNDLEELLSE